MKWHNKMSEKHSYMYRTILTGRFTLSREMKCSAKCHVLLTAVMYMSY